VVENKSGKIKSILSESFPPTLKPLTACAEGVFYFPGKSFKKEVMTDCLFEYPLFPETGIERKKITLAPFSP
jgi:hypothetical protein